MMQDLHWCSPLMVRMQTGAERKFAGPSDALACLEREWPTHGRHHARARRECRMALYGETSADRARESFLAACLEAGLDLPAFNRPERGTDRSLRSS